MSDSKGALPEHSRSKELFWRDKALKAEAGLSELRAEVERNRVDAERYRWLRDEAHPDREDTGISAIETDFNSWGKPFNRHYYGKELDTKLDAARTGAAGDGND